MKARLKVQLLALTTLFAMLCSPLALAVPSSDNAALRYWQAWSIIGEGDLSRPFGVEYGKYDPDMNLSEEGQPVVTNDDLLARTSDGIQLLIEAAAMPACDFGIDYRKGLEVLLPPVSPMRRSVQLLVLDAERLIASGDIDQASIRIVAALQTSQHVAADGTLINALVSMACFSHVDGFIQHHSDQFEDSHRKDIAHALARFNREDPFHCIGAVRNEAKYFGEWMMRRVDAEWADQDSFLSDLNLLFDDDTASEMGRDAIAKHFSSHLDFQHQLRTEISKYTTWMMLLAEAWNKPHAVESIEALETQLRDGNFGFIAHAMAPSLTRSHTNDMKNRAALEDLMKWAAR